VSKGRCHGNQFLGLKLLLTCFVWTILTRQLCRYCRYPAPKERCHGNPLLPFDGL